MNQGSTEHAGPFTRAMRGARLAVSAFHCFEPYDAAKVLLLRGLGRAVTMEARLRSSTHRVALRPTDSDVHVAAQIFGGREYALDDVRTEALRQIAADWRTRGVTPIIVDAGANVGYSSLFFADTYADAHVIALEPDPPTFEVLESNVRGRSNVEAHPYALWSDDGGVDLEDGGQKSWSTRVNGNGSRRIPSRTLEQVVSSVPNGRLLIAKVDIEGAEREALGVSIELLRDTPCIMIEPHDWMLPGHGSLQPILSAVVLGNYDVVVRGENVFFVQSKLGLPPI